MSAESPRHVRSGGPLTVPSQPPSDRSIIDAVSGFINDVTLSSSSAVDPKDVIQWARFETADINEPTPEGDSDNDVSPLLLILGYGAGVQVWLISPNGEAQEVLSWRQGTVRVLRILPTPQHGDCFASKRPLIALCDSASPGPAFCSLSFISIRGGEQVKSIKFKNPILDVLANKRSVVVSFSERFAVFDAATLEDRLAITTCYPCPCPLGGSSPINPLALGDRWLAYADKKLNPSKRSSGGCESEGVTSYTATVLHAAKSLSKGLRGLGESVAHSLAGGRSTSQSPSPPHTDIQQPGIVTILDIEGNEDEDSQDCEEPCDPIVAHFIAHSEAIIALKFDPSGMLLITADRRGHDFHVFRINPHPCGPSLASVHHLYILHRGDTTAKVQDIAISGDSRWAAVSSLRGTTHVFALSPYGGACGVRTHTQPRVVNRLSRFHRSAGLPIHAAAAHAHTHTHTHTPGLEGSVAGAWYPNPRLPPYPLPSTSTPLAQLRPTHNLPTHTITRTSSGRQRLSSLSEESGAAPLLARSRFGCALPSASGRGCAVPLYLMAANGSLLHLLLHPRPARCVAKEKICDESPIEVEVEAVAQWMLQRPAAAADLLAPLPPSNPLLQPLSCRRCADMCVSEEERWLSQVEIVTHAGPHRRLWMGPQFVFKTYNCGSNSSLSEAEAVEVDTSAGGGAARSNPVNMPGVRPVVPVLISSGSASSLEHSPSDSFRRKSLLAEGGRAAVCDVQLKEDLAEAMKEDHGLAAPRGAAPAPGAAVVRAVDPLGCVVAPPPAAPAPRADADADADAHTRPNADEAAFRPVLRAPAAPPPDLPARALPLTTTIPAQALPAPPAAPPVTPPDAPAPRALPTDVVIPAQLHAPAPAPPPADAVADVSLPMSSRAPDDIQPAVRPRVKRSPPTKLSSDRVAASASFKDKQLSDPKSAKVDKTDVFGLNIEKAPREDFARKSSKPKNTQKTIEKDSKEATPPPFLPKDINVSGEKKSAVDAPSKEPEPNSAKTKAFDNEIKTEEQAWDLLLNESNKQTVVNPDIPTYLVEKADETKSKTKKGRRAKKLPEDQQSKEDDDNFVEIHAIEEKQQPSSGELVSISTTFDDFESSVSSLTKSRKQRASKSFTPERKIEESPKNIESINNMGKTKKSFKDDGTDTLFDLEQTKPSSNVFSSTKQNNKEDTFFETCKEVTSTSLKVKEKSKSPKSKSPSPNFERRKSSISEKHEDGEKEVYVINTAEEEFPEIQITTANKTRKKSPQPVEKCEKPKELIMPNRYEEANVSANKSWSSIVTKKAKQTDEKEEKIVKTEVVKAPERQEVDNNSPGATLQEKLAELCKRTDIMVAECDTPSELNFVEEHHSVSHDFPPLDGLDFALDDFKLEVMKDSLLDAGDTKIASPICKINIDDILSSMKDISKSDESTSFNLIDVQQMPARKEKGFSVLETDKITTQEVQADDEVKSEKYNDMEKSSDEDGTSPVVSTDSDKEDKKTGATNVTIPSPKQSKAKKSRKKKK